MRLLQRLSRAGLKEIDGELYSLDERISPDLILLTNELLLRFTFASFTYCCLMLAATNTHEAFSDSPILLSLLFLFPFLWPLGLFLNSLGLYDLARFHFIINVNLGTCYWAFTLSPASGVHTIGISYTLLPIILFEKHRRWAIASLTPIPFLVYFFAELFPAMEPYYSPLLLLPAPALTFLRFLSALTTCFFMTNYVIILQSQYENKLNSLRKVSQAKAEFLQSMSHEIRTPMSSIIGLTDLLLNSPIMREPELRQFVKTIHSSGESLLCVVDDILDLSKIEAGMLNLFPVDCHLVDFIEETAIVFAASTHKKGLELVVEFAPQISFTMPPLRLDETRLRQILNNLLGNAIKFTIQGQVLLRVSLSSSAVKPPSKDVPSKSSADRQPLGHEGGCPFILFEIQDSGIGVQEAVIPLLFTNFFQAEQSSKKFGGTGLGLAICKHLTKLMGGEIGVESIFGRGSTFWFTLPLIPSPEAPCRSSSFEEELISLRARLQGRSIFFHYPNHSSSLLLERIFSSWGLRATSFPTFQLLSLALREQGERGELPDLLLSSYESLKEQGAFPIPQQVRRVAVISWSYQLACDRSVADAFVSAPIFERHLVMSLLKALGQETKAQTELFFGAALTDSLLSQSHNSTDQPWILIAEDNPVNQEVMKALLKRLSIACNIVSNGREVLEALEQHPYDIILMDVNMPELNGIETTRLIRKREADWHREAERSAASSNHQQEDPAHQSNSSGRQRPLHIPVVATTANVLLEDRRRCKEAGMDDFISKPIRLHQLEKVVKGFLGQRKPL